MAFPLYFDWAATAIPDEPVIAEASQVALTYYGNPSSRHKAGAQAREKLEQARSRCAQALYVAPETIVFTSGGTEANQLILLSLLQRPKAGNILVSSIEHPAVREQARALAACGWRVRELPVNEDGIMAAQTVANALDGDTAAVFIMAVNNETGAIQPIADIARALRDPAHGARHIWLHTDCVQAAGKIPVLLNEWGADSAAFSAHKLGGPRGAGLLYAARRFEPFLKGGGQENGMRSGTENLFGAWALSCCLQKRLLRKEAPQTLERCRTQKQQCADFICALRNIPGCSIIPAVRDGNMQNEENYSPWIVQASFKGVPGEVMVRALSEQGIYISTGSACSSKKKQRSVLQAMGVAPDLAQNAVRFSFGPETTREDMHTLAAAVQAAAAMFCR